MNRLIFYILIIAAITGAASAAEISGTVSSEGKKLSNAAVTLSRINSTSQSEGIIVYDFVLLEEKATDKSGNYVFNELDIGEYRVNATYNGTTQGKNLVLKDRATVDFNLSGKVEGFVLKAGVVLEGVQVRLIDKSGIEVMNTLTNKNGRYSFNKVDLDTYFVETLYEDVPYTKQVNASENADFMVYESTKEGDGISVNIDHVVFSKAFNGIKVDQYVEFINTGEKVFFSKDRTWLGISTPEGITRFQTDVMECCLVREKDSVWIDPMKPLMPDETYSVQISYVFNPQTSMFNKGTIYNTSYMSLLSDKNNGFGIESVYARKEIVPNQGKEFEVLTFANVPKGQFIETQITGYVPSKSEEGFNYLIPLLAVVLIGAVSYPLLRNRIKRKTRSFIKQAPVQEQEPDVIEYGYQGIENAAAKDITEMSFHELHAEKNAVFESILALENKFNAGEISEEEYKNLKKERKEKAMPVIRQLKETALNLDLSMHVEEVEKAVARIDDIDILEKLLEREKEGEDRSKLKESIEQRIDDIERNE